MMNKFKKGELVIISGRGKEFNEENTNVLGRIKEKDYYFNQYLVEVFFGKNDWFKEEDLTPVFEKKNRKKDKYKVGLVIEDRGLRYILDEMREKEYKTINMFKKADIFQEFNENDKTYFLIIWSNTYWANTNYTVQEIEKALPILKKENIGYQYIVLGISDKKYIKIDEFTKNDSNVDILELSTKIKIKKIGGYI